MSAMLRITVLGMLLVGSSCLLTREKNSRHLNEVSLIPKEDAAPDPQKQEAQSSQPPPVPTTTRCVIIMCVQYMVIYMALAVCRTYHEFTSTGKGEVEAGLKSAAQTLTYGPMLCVLFIACRMRVEFLSEGRGQPQMWVQNCMYAVTFSVLASSVLVLFIPMVTGKSVPLKEGGYYLETPGTDGNYALYALTFTRYLILLGIHGGLVGIIVGIHMYLPPGETDVSNLPPPAPAVMCTMILAVVFFITQLAIAACHTCEECKCSFLHFPRIIGVMNAATAAVEFAPMIAILFLAARMQALQHNGQPQAWAQNCMFITTGSMCVTTLLAVLVPLLMGGHMEVNSQTRETTFVAPTQPLGYVFVALRFFFMLCCYAGAIGVMYSIFVFEAPSGPTLPVAPAVQCVVNLTLQFFFVYFMTFVMLTVSELSGGKFPLETYPIYSGLEAAKSTVAFAPMLSILFVTTRMYALLITDNKGAPPAWVQDGMFMATWSVFISFMACLGTSLFMDKVETDDDGNIVNKFSNTYLAIVMTGLRYLTMFLLYGGILLVIVGIFEMTPETANGRGSVPVLTDAREAAPTPQDVTKVGGFLMAY